MMTIKKTFLTASAVLIITNLAIMLIQLLTVQEAYEKNLEEMEALYLKTVFESNSSEFIGSILLEDQELTEALLEDIGRAHGIDISYSAYKKVEADQSFALSMFDRKMGYINMDLEEQSISMSYRFSFFITLLWQLLILLLSSVGLSNFLKKRYYTPLINLLRYTSDENPHIFLRSKVPEFKVIESYLSQLKADVKRNASNSAIAITTQMLAHDVRKPFTLMESLVDTVAKAKNISAVRRVLHDSLPEISASLVSVNGMIQDVMEVGKTDTSLAFEATSVDKILDGSLSRIFGYESRANIDLEYELTHDCLVGVDELKMGRVFDNIIGNAVEHMNFSGRMWFRTSQLENMLKICIGNSDTFIPEDDRKTLFDPFFTKNKKDGTGLGLAIARKVVNAHSGEIWCESSKQDGTEFYFTLPISADARCKNIDTMDLLSSSKDYFENNKMKIESGKSTESFDQQENHGMLERLLSETLKEVVRIAIIDDEATYRKHLISHIESSESIATKLRATEFTIIEDFLNSNEFVDFIILDVDFGKSMMNGLDGIPLIKEKSPSSKIFVHSNRGVLDYQAQAIEAGADLFLPKPMSKFHFLKILASSIGLTDEQIINQSTNLNSQLGSKVILVEDSLTIASGWMSELQDLVHFTNFVDFNDFLLSLGETKEPITIVTDYDLGEDKNGIDVALRVKELDYDFPIYLSSNVGDLSADQLSLFSGVLPKLPSEAIEKLRQDNIGIHELKENKMSMEKFKEEIKGKRLLIVEDDSFQREFYLEEAEDYFSCREASTYEAAIQEIESNEFDFLLTDIHLTNHVNDPCDGLKIMAFARKTHPNITIIGMSTDANAKCSDVTNYFASKPLIGGDAILEAIKKGYEANHDRR